MESKSRGSGVVAIGADHAGYRLKETLKVELTRKGFRIMDTGTDSEDSCDYPDFAAEVADAVRRGDAEKGVLVCGTGIGMAMAANKVPGVRAAVCNDAYCARYGRAHTDANVLTIGSRVVGESDARIILATFLDTGFEGDTEGGARHVRRLQKIEDLERKYGTKPTSRKD